MSRIGIAQNIYAILVEIEGEKDLRPGLRDTPMRVARAYEEMFDGYGVDIDKLFTTFDGEGTDQVVVVKNHHFDSTCEHHIMNFSGVASVAYLPNGRAIGASKIPRLINAYAHRLQIQERLTEQIGNAIWEYLQPHGVAVVIEASHSCMKCRGVKSPESSMITSVMLGRFREDQSLRMEVLSLLGIRS